jgi:hypothetical protein
MSMNVLVTAAAASLAGPWLRSWRKRWVWRARDGHNPHRPAGLQPRAFHAVAARGQHGPKNGDSESCRIAILLDNLGRFQERHSQHARQRCLSRQ